MKLVLIDDERKLENITWVRYPDNLQLTVLKTFDEFKTHIDSITQQDVYETIYSFDHDLQDFDENGKEYTGLTCAKYLIETLENKQLDYKGSLLFLSHSQNPSGRNNIEKYLTQHTKIDLVCCGCGHQGPDVYSDGYGFNICRVNSCTQESVRGLSRQDFY